MELNMKINKTFGLIISILLILSIFENVRFAAIVSDNDGSAFITKKEFESLKSDFASQIMSYNNSIDSKIDGAIAAYHAAMGKKKIIQHNNYTEIEKSKKLEWISKNDYANTLIAGYPEMDLTHTERYLQGSVEWHAVFDRQARINAGQWAFDEIYCCNHDKTDESKVYVERLRDIVPKFTFTDQYVFSAFCGLTSTTNSYELSGRSPEYYITGISLINTVNSHEYRNDGNLNKTSNRVHEDRYNRTSARYIYDVVSYSANTTYTYDYLTLAPKSNSNTYYYQLDCEEVCDDNNYVNKLYNGSNWPGFVVSVSNNTSAITITSTTITYPQLNFKPLNSWINSFEIPSTENVPWLRKQLVQKNLGMY